MKGAYLTVYTITIHVRIVMKGAYLTGCKTQRGILFKCTKPKFKVLRFSSGSNPNFYPHFLQAINNAWSLTWSVRIIM